MATWVTHLLIADNVLQEFTEIDRRGFCVGNIAPDCNIENADWTAFTPSREVTHWMRGRGRKRPTVILFVRNTFLSAEQRYGLGRNTDSCWDLHL